MDLHFNIGGPCFPDGHYMLPPERRLGQARELIDQGLYFVLMSGRQTGKTTSVQWLVQALNAGDRHCACWVDLETAGEQSEPTLAFRTLLDACDHAFSRDLPTLTRPDSEQVELWLRDPPSALLNYLAAMSAEAPRPLVVLLDETDGLVGPTMVSFLTQLREGYIARKETPFPWSVALVGTRAVRDYGVSTEDRSAMKWLGTASPFNITAETATLVPFTRDYVTELLGQHTAATGQRFELDAAARIYELSLGHPWLVNALADQIVRRDVRDRSIAVTAAHVDSAKETIILERRTHIDSLVAKLRDPRVRRIIDPMLAGTQLPTDALDDDLAYVLGLGLIRVVGGEYVVANPIYREVIPRALTWVQQHSLHHPTQWYLRPDGSLDMPKLMTAWQKFWRQDGHLAAEGFTYRESGPHLMLMAFLQRVVNGGGRVEREYGLGRRALDLIVEWREARHAIEVKLRRDTETEDEALEQLTCYLDTAGLAEGWLVMFDLRSTQPWTERLTTRTMSVDGRQIHLVGC